MTNQLVAIVLNMSGYKYPRASFVRYNGEKRSSRTYLLRKRHWLMLHAAQIKFLPCLDIGWSAWVQGLS